MKYQIVFSFLALLTLTSCQNQQNKTTATAQNPTTQASETNAIHATDIKYEIIDSPEQTFGYDIFVNGVKMIHQPQKPGIAGNQGFKTKESAEKVAKLVMKKIENGELPPTVSEEELKQLGVL